MGKVLIALIVFFALMYWLYIGFVAFNNGIVDNTVKKINASQTINNKALENAAKY